ncbi:MAG: hypothetical protein IJ558_08740 [Treponema sp.]|nr:hypothetical protein [Treponema sp.]
MTFIDKANLPEEKEIIDLDNPSENLIAALTPTIVTSTTFSFVSDTIGHIFVMLTYLLRQMERQIILRLTT